MAGAILPYVLLVTATSVPAKGFVTIKVRGARLQLEVDASNQALFDLANIAIYTNGDLVAISAGGGGYSGATTHTIDTTLGGGLVTVTPVNTQASFII